MKILSLPKPHSDWHQEHVCMCGTHFEFNLDDLDYAEWKVSGYHFDGTAVCEWRLTVNCPGCGNTFHVKDNWVPVSWFRQKEKTR